MKHTVAITSPGKRTAFHELEGLTLEQIEHQAINLAGHEFQGAYAIDPDRVQELRDMQQAEDEANTQVVSHRHGGMRKARGHNDCFEDMENILRQIPGTSESALRR